MIEKMKVVHIVAAASGKELMLNQLKDLGVVHISEKKNADPAVSARFNTLSRTVQALTDYTPKKYEDPGIQSDEEFEAMYDEVLKAMEKKSGLFLKLNEAKSELERIQDWGDFSPQDIEALKAEGFDLHFYRLGAREYEALKADESIAFVRLASVEKMDTVAVLGALPPSIPATEFVLPACGAAGLRRLIADCSAEAEECDRVLENAAVHKASFNAQMLKAKNEENFSSAHETVQSDGDLIWISGFVPDADIESFKAAATENGWAWAVDEVPDDCEDVPTKVRYNKVTRLIKPVFDILGVLPGYREQDISFWFLLFLTLFFAMILGDGGYGLLLLIGTIALTIKSRKVGDVEFLLFIMSIATVAWGAVTGTWFASEAAMKVPFLKALVIPSIANYPEYFGVTTAQQQNAIMKFSFTVGAVHMFLGSLLSVKKKIGEKDLSFVADAGWMIAIIAMYLLSLFLVIGEKISVKPLFVAIGAAFVLVAAFGGMSPDKSFGEGLKAGLGDAFTVFLNTISCFGNVMSYIRLFAVGMAGLAIGQSFNSMASGFSGPLIIAGALIVIIGHTLNIVMAFLSVVVHGVRLNVLEFSGQAGIEWAGIPYEPFEETKKIKN